MNADVEKLFFEALEVSAAERDNWLNRAAAGQAEIAAEVRSLLDAHDASESAATSRRVGPYRLERLLGRGAMGEVWLAARADGEYEHRVALKLVRSGLGVDALLPRFRRERQLLARLTHPYIARLLDGGVSPDGRPYLVMDYVEGEPILDFCERNGLSIRARLELFRKLCSAVECAHQNLVVHRDIKPGNILVTADGQPKLLDFGIAKLVEDEDAASATAFPMLTPRYASPEQLCGEEITTSSDIYSLGVLLFELLTGSLPYRLQANSPTEIISAVTTLEPRVPSQVGRVPAGDLDAIVAKTLEKDPSRRYSSVERLAADIGNYLDGLPVNAQAPTRLYRMRKYVRRHWIGVLAAGTVTLSLAAATVISMRSAHIADRQRLRAQRVTRFLEEVLNSADPGQRETGPGMGANVKVVDALAAARERIPTAFADDLAIQVELHAVIGYTFMDLRLLPMAEEEIQAALRGIRALDDNPAMQVKLLVAAGELDFYQGRHALAEKRIRDSLEMIQRSKDAMADPDFYPLALSDLSIFVQARGATAEAREYLNRAVKWMQAQPSPSAYRLGMLKSNLAFLDLSSGNLAMAETEARQGVEKLSTSSRAQIQLVYPLLNYGLIERYLGNPSAAVQAFEQGAAVAVATAGPDHVLALIGRIELAYQRAQTGRIHEAEVELEHCLELTRKPEGKAQLHRALWALGSVRTLAGRPHEGEPLLQQALEMAQKAQPKLDYVEAQVEIGLGECLERQGRVAGARGFYQAGEAAYLRAFGPDVWATRDAAAHLARLRR
jgi:serine/threonine-protein kinase